MTECIREGILADFLLKNRAEAIEVSIFEYDEEKEIELFRAAEREEGREEGRAEGLAEGEMSKGLEIARQMKAEGLPVEMIARCTGLSIEQIKDLKPGEIE